MLVVAAMGDEPLPEAAALVRSRLLGRGAAVELALGPLDRSALATVAQRAAARPLPPANPRRHHALSGGQSVLRRRAGRVGGRLRRGHGVGPPARGRRAAARAARAVRRAAAHRSRRDRGRLHGGGAGGLGGHRSRRGGARPRPSRPACSSAARGRYRFRHSLVREQLAARLPEEALRRAHADAAARLATEDAPPERVAHHLLGAGRGPRRRSRSSPRRPSGRWTWARTATVRRGPSRRSSTRPITQRPGLLALRAQLLHGAGEPNAPAAYAEAIEVAPAGAGARAARASTRERAWPRATSRAPRLRSSSSRPSGPRTSASRSSSAAWWRGTPATGTARAGWPRRRTPLPPIRATSPC